MKNNNIFQSVRCAVRGIFNCCKEERNFRDYGVIALIVLILNIILGAGLWEYIVFIILTCAVFSAEFLNTAIERLVDNQGEINENFKFIKDAAAAGVLAMGIAFFACEGAILIPKFIERYL